MQSIECSVVWTDVRKAGARWLDVLAWQVRAYGRRGHWDGQKEDTDAVTCLVRGRGEVAVGRCTTVADRRAQRADICTCPDMKTLFR